MASGQQDIPDLLQHLLDVYQNKELGAVGADAQRSNIDALYAGLKTDAERSAAYAMLRHFLSCSRAYLADHPAQSQFMMAEGFGVELAGGIQVALTPALNVGSGELEDAGEIHITEPRSIRGQQGVVPTTVQPVTGVGDDRTVQRPG